MAHHDRTRLCDGISSAIGNCHLRKQVLSTINVRFCRLIRMAWYGFRCHRTNFRRKSRLWIFIKIIRLLFHYFAGIAELCAIIFCTPSTPPKRTVTGIIGAAFKSRHARRMIHTQTCAFLCVFHARRLCWKHVTPMACYITWHVSYKVRYC
jgi:hypothetical protein